MTYIRLLLLCALSGLPAAETMARDAITVLFTGDTAGKLKPDHNGRGGYARRITVLEQARQHTGASITVDIGNFLSPDYLVQKSEGRTAVTLAVMAGYNVITPGQHDFDYGSDVLALRAGELAAAGITLINANILKPNNVPLLPPYSVKTIRTEYGERRLLFIGIIDPALLDRRFYPGMIVRTPERALELCLDELRSERYDAVICLAHLDRSESMRLAERFPAVDAFICLGEERNTGLHTALITDLTRRRQSLIVNAGRYGYEAGALHISLPDDNSASPALSVQSLPVDADANADAEAEQLIFLEDTHADFPVFTVEPRQNDADSLIALLMAHMKYVTRSEVAVLRRGMFDATCLPFKNDTLTFNDLYQFIPAGEHLVRMHLTGRQLTALVRQGRSVNRHHPSYLYCNGYDPASGTINGKIPYADDRYTVVTSSYLAAGGGGYAGFTGGTKRSYTFTDDGFLRADRTGQRTELRGDLFIPGLIHWRTSADTRFTDLTQRPLWRVSLRTLGMSARQSWWNGATPDYTTVPNFPTQDLQHVDSRLAVTAERLSTAGRWKNEFDLEYGRESFAGTDIYDSPDDAVLTSRFEYPSLLKRPGMLQTLYPFIQLKLDSEVMPEDGQPRELDAYADLGLGIAAGGFSDIRLSLGAVRDLAADDVKTSFSIGVTSLYDATVPFTKNVEYLADLRYTGKLRTGYSEHRITFENLFDIPLIGTLSLRTGGTAYAYLASDTGTWAAAGAGTVMLNYAFTARWQRM